MIQVQVLDPAGFTLRLSEHSGARWRVMKSLRAQLFLSENRAIVQDHDAGQVLEVTWEGDRLKVRDLSRQEALF